MSRNPYGCQCGMTFRTAIAEARHRHNFPLLCRQPKAPKPLDVYASDVGRRIKTDIAGATRYGVITYQGGTSAYVCIDGDNYSRVIPKTQLKWEKSK